MCKRDLFWYSGQIQILMDSRRVSAAGYDRLLQTKTPGVLFLPNGEGPSIARRSKGGPGPVGICLGGIPGTLALLQRAAKQPCSDDGALKYRGAPYAIEPYSARFKGGLLDRRHLTILPPFRPRFDHVSVINVFTK